MPALPSPVDLLRRAREHSNHAREFDASVVSLDFVATRLPEAVLAGLERDRTSDALREKFELELSRSRRPEDAVARVVTLYIDQLHTAISAVAIETRMQAASANGQATALLDLAKEFIKASMQPGEEAVSKPPEG